MNNTDTEAALQERVVRLEGIVASLQLTVEALSRIANPYPQPVTYPAPVIYTEPADPCADCVGKICGNVACPKRTQVTCK